MRAVVVVAFAVGAWLHGRYVGANGVQAEWDQDKMAQAETQRLAKRANARQATDAAAQFEAFRARNVAALIATRVELRNALSRPICPVDGHEDPTHALQLADLPVPGSAVDRLRRAAAGGGAP